MSEPIDLENLQDFPWAKEQAWMEFEEQLRRTPDVDSEFLEEMLRRCRRAIDTVYIDATVAVTAETEASLRVHLEKLFGELCNREMRILRLEMQVRGLGGTVEGA